ncbi:Protein enhanced disease resistance 2 [Vitis vinifera]|uniref:Protein enhanced disease resistance 2 n=1 Tax=Vitis vinifera TaxID=29760 RepID=A0A438D9L1_VITVI|nr:Protein enhanced disease resistance 2 [Vitis vinifera]
MKRNIQRHVFFIFTLYDTSNPNNQLKLGASSSEEAAKWIHSLQEAVTKECANPTNDVDPYPKSKKQYLRVAAIQRSKRWDSHRMNWDDHPAIMAVGVVDATPEAIFQVLMSLGPSRSEWDFCFYQGSVVEHLDGHTDIVHEQFYRDWLPWGMNEEIY